MLKLYKAAASQGIRLWSVSKLRKFECPRAGHKHYVLKEPEPESSAARFGRAVHAALAAAVGEGKGLDEAVAAAMRAVPLPHEEEAEVRRVAGGVLSTLPVRPERLVGCEEEIIVSLDDGVALHSVLDVLEIDGGAAWITDWKTSWHPQDREEVRRNLQAQCYAMAVAMEYRHVEEIFVRMRFARFDSDTVVRFERDEAESFFDGVRERVRRLEELLADPAAEFPAAPGAHCSLCGYARDCPAAGAGGAGRHSASLAEAEALAGEILALDARRAAVMGSLREYVERNGEFSAHGYVWGYEARRSWRIACDPEDFVRLLRDAGRDPADVLSVQARKVPENLKHLLEARVWTVFGPRKAT